MTGISVVIPAWDAARTIAETLASVLAQTRLPDEILVIDDGSTDETGRIAAALSPRIRVLRQENRGAAAAANAGFAAASGALLAPLDADDLWPPDKLAEQDAALAARPDWAGIGGQVESFLCPSLDEAERARYRVTPGPASALLAGTMLIRRAVFDRIGPYAEDLAAGHHIDWLDRAQRAGFAFGVLDRLVLRRRIHPGSLSHRTAKRDQAMLAMARRMIQRRRGD